MMKLKIKYIFFLLILLQIGTVHIALAESSLKPDLVISKIETTVAVGPGTATRVVHEDMVIDVTVMNRGNAIAGYSALHFSIVKGLSKVNVLPLAYQRDHGISSQAPHSSEVSGQLWTPDKPGAYTIQVCADFQDEIVESNEKNNCLTQKIIIQPRTGTVILPGRAKPDLVVKDIYTYNDYSHDRFGVHVGLAKWKGVVCPGMFRVSLAGIDKEGNVHDGLSFSDDQPFVDVRFRNPADGTCYDSPVSIDFYFSDVSAADIVTLKPVIDVNQEVSESNEENNTPTLPGQFRNFHNWY